MADIIQGQKYEHFKGGTYKVICQATDTADSTRQVVVYTCLENDDKPDIVGRNFIRTLEEFVGFKDNLDPTNIKRFELIKE